MGECQQLTSCKHPFDILSPVLTAQARTHPPRAQTQGSQGANRPLPCPLTCTSLLLSLQELPELKDASFPELGVLWGQPALGVTPTEGIQGGTVGGRSFPGGKIQAQSSLPPAYFKPQAETEGQGKPCGPPRGKTASMRVPRPHFLSALHHRIARDPKRGSGWVGWVSWNSPPGQVAPAAGLEADDDVRDLQVSLLLRWASTPARKKTLLWPMRYRLLLSSRASIQRRRASC